MCSAAASSKDSLAGHKLVFVGGANLDETVTLERALQPGASNSATWRSSVGGVAANASRAAAAANVSSTIDIHLIAALASDAAGNTIRQTFDQLRVNTHFELSDTENSGRYTALLDTSGELIVGMANTELGESLSPDYLTSTLSQLEPTGVLAFDTNLSVESLHLLATQTSPEATKIAMAVSPIKAMRLLGIATQIDLLFLNRLEAAMMTGLGELASVDAYSESLTSLGFSRHIITDGAQPVLVCLEESRHSLPVPPLNINLGGVNGLGDALAGGTIAALVSAGPATLSDSEALANCIRQSGFPACNTRLKTQGA